MSFRIHITKEELMEVPFNQRCAMREAAIENAHTPDRVALRQAMQSITKERQHRAAQYAKLRQFLFEKRHITQS